MAKSRSGLGRGLESLLGGGFDTSFRTEANTNTPTVKQEDNSTDYHENLASGSVNISPDVNEGGNEVSANEGNTAETQSGGPNQYAEAKENGSPVRTAPDGEISISLIEPNPDQPRTNFKEEELAELAESIRQNGLLQPILVRRVGSKYQIIAGERRWQACKRLGMSAVPVIVKDADDDESIILALIENIQRSNLNPIEEAYGYRRMMERGKMTQSEVAQAVSKGRTTITNSLRLLELPEEAQQLLFDEKITAGHARAILSIPSKEGRKKLTEKLVEDKLSVRDAERIARLLAGKEQKTDDRTSKAKPPKSYKTVARALSEKLEADVKIKTAGGKNKIEVVFKDEADLERLYRIISGPESN